MSGNTAFISYILIPTGTTVIDNYSQAIHCNYIHKINLSTTNPYVQEISLNFPNINDFKFLASSTTGSTNPYGIGYTAHKIHALVQIVNNSGFTTYADVKPYSDKWKQVDITSQVTGYTSGGTVFLTPAQLTTVVFKISLLNYTGFTAYNLDYLNYPSSSQVGDDDILAFGEATFFFGNVKTQIKADVYTTDISINLPLNEFNSSTNLTWGDETVYISEIGIYDSNKNLVAIGKLNDPVAKDGTIARTIVFALDF